MVNLKRAYQQESSKLATLESRRSELAAKGKDALQALEAERERFGRELAAGDGAVETLASQLSKRQAESAVFDAALQELSEQINEQTAIVERAEGRQTAEEKAETSRQIRVAGLRLIKRLADLQLDIAVLSKKQQVRDLHVVNFDVVATRLEEAQDAIERDATIREKSKVPNAMRRAGWVDDSHTVPTLGSAIRDWARLEANK